MSQGPPHYLPRYTLSNAFSRSTKAIHRSLFFSKNLSWICLTINIASVVPFPDLKPNCISLIDTSLLNNSFKDLHKSYGHLVCVVPNISHRILTIYTRVG